MSVLIKGMEMPTSCIECRFGYDGKCFAHQPFKRFVLGQEVDCPLAPVPPHGRLIDADALLHSLDAEICDCNPSHFDLEDKDGYGSWMLRNGINTGIVAARVRIKNATTIIEAEEG